YQRAVLSFVPTFTPVPAYVENPLVTEHAWDVRIGTALSSLLFYLQKLVVPYPLSFYYGYDAFPLGGVFSVRAALAFAAYATLALYVIRKWRTGSAAAF